MDVNTMVKDAMRLPVMGACSECRYLSARDADRIFHKCGRRGYQFVSDINPDGDCKMWAPKMDDEKTDEKEEAQTLPVSTKITLASTVGALFLIALSFAIVYRYSTIPVPSTYYECSDRQANAIRLECDGKFDEKNCKKEARKLNCKAVRGFEYVGPDRNPLPCSEAISPREKQICGQ